MLINTFNKFFDLTALYGTSLLSPRDQFLRDVETVELFL